MHNSSQNDLPKAKTGISEGQPGLLIEMLAIEPKDRALGERWFNRGYERRRMAQVFESWKPEMY
jgi:hypothetical protein